MDYFTNPEKIQQLLDEAGRTHSHDLLQHLKLLLESQHNLISNGPKISYNLENLYKLPVIDCNNCNLLYDIIKFALQIQKNETELLKLSLFANNEMKRNSNLKLEVLKILIIVFELSNSNKEFLLNENLMQTRFITNLQNFNNKTFLLQKVIPSYLQLENATCKEIFAANLIKHSVDALDLETFTVLVGNIIKNCPEVYLEQLKTNHKFWIVLENCIASDNVLIQKQATYALRTSVNFTIKSAENLALFPYVDLQFKTSSNENITKFWDNYFVLLDISREKQLHLIEPCLNPLLQNIKQLHTIWQTCIFKILLHHFQNTVVYFTATKFFSEYGINIFSSETIRITLKSINKNELNHLTKLTFTELNKFCCNLEDDQLQILLEESLEITWNPVGMWNFIKSVITSETCPKINFFTLQKIIYSVKNLPHITIREGCLEIISNLFNFYSFEFKQLLELYGLFNSYTQKKLKLNKKIISDVNSLNNELNSWSDFERVKLGNAENLLNIAWDDAYFNTAVYENFSKFCDPIKTIICVEFDILSDTLNEEVKLFVTEKLFKFQSDPPVFVKHSRCFFKYGLIRDKDSLVKFINNPRENFFKQIIAFNILYENFNENTDLDSTVLEEIKTEFIVNFNSVPENICHNFLKFYLSNYGCIGDLMFCYKVFDRKIPEISLLIIKQTVKLLLNDNENALNKCEDLLVQFSKQGKFDIILCEFLEQLFQSGCTDQNISFYTGLIQIFEHNNYILYLLLNWIPDDFVEAFLSVIVESLFYGIITQKTERTEYLICKEIFELENSEYQKKNNPIIGRRLLFSAASVKLLTAAKNKKLGSEIALKLISKYEKYYAKRYFPDSQIDYEKQRIVQMLLIIQPYILEADTKNKLINLIISSFCDEIHQPCIKQLSQWLLILLLSDESHENCVEIIFNKINSASRTQPSSIIGFIPVLFHLTCLKQDEACWGEIFKALLPWTMGAHFKLRVYSQAALSRLYEEATRKSFKEVTEKYKFLYESLQKIIQESGNAFGEALKHDREFFDNFHPLKHYSWQTIFEDFPKLNNVNQVKWEYFFHPKMTFESLEKPPLVVYCIKDSSFHKIVAEKFETFSKISDNCKEKCLNIENIQRKITPWKPAVVLENFSDLILVTSLIEKSTNLGGLSRTCEVFGVKQLVMNNWKIIHDKEFKSLSMSSENWVDVLEVKIDDLGNFVSKIKEQGYAVVGAEQTSNSSYLDNYKFTKKTAVVLGHEKEGIPANLIPFLDVCLEIPQFGQIRSLNVHVAGALFIWEYAKQHLIK